MIYLNAHLIGAALCFLILNVGPLRSKINEEILSTDIGSYFGLQGTKLIISLIGGWLIAIAFLLRMAKKF